MSIRTLFTVLAISSAGLGSMAQAQPLDPPVMDFGFDQSKSVGVVNIVNGATQTLTPDADGMVYVDSLTMGPTNSKLFFNRNAKNTPIYLISAGPIVIGSGAIIHANGESTTTKVGGRGGPGGFDGATSPSAGQNDYAPGFGPAGGHSGGGGFDYGNVSFMIPLIGGSGGGSHSSWNGGGGGGGAILLASETSIEILGTINVEGGCGNTCGAAGSVRLLSPIVKGTPKFLNATRRRIDTIDASGLTDTNSATVGAVMVAMPAEMPRIDVIEVDDVPVENLDDGIAQFIQFPLDSATRRTLTVRIENLTGVVPIGIRLVPEYGTATRYLLKDAINNDLEIYADDQGGVAERTFTVDVPANRRTTIEVWTRPEIQP
ncbi:MAG: hypothetical protein IT385_15920 [Deltaproteobacteria bacterium]|nr:hypothetical protein [Deltaproteobacteria bacterium]